MMLNRLLKSLLNRQLSHIDQSRPKRDVSKTPSRF
jgi:hypothetical protein